MFSLHLLPVSLALELSQHLNAGVWLPSGERRQTPALFPLCHVEAVAALRLHTMTKLAFVPRLCSAPSQRLSAGPDFSSGGESLPAGGSLSCHFPFACPEHPDDFG